MHLLKIETGRWTNIARDNRICTQCRQNTVEDDYHFLFDCTMHATRVIRRAHLVSHIIRGRYDKILNSVNNSE